MDNLSFLRRCPAMSIAFTSFAARKSQTPDFTHQDVTASFHIMVASEVYVKSRPQYFYSEPLLLSPVILKRATLSRIILSQTSVSSSFCCTLRGAVAQSVERATSGEEVLSSIPAVAACSLLVGSVSV